MRKTLAVLLILSTCSWMALGDSTKDCVDRDPLFGEAPRVQKATPLITGDVPVLENRTYVVGYGEERLNPLWVCYRIYGAVQSGIACKHGWRIDDRTNSRVSTGDYEFTSYERGHMAPKSAIYHCYGADACYSTFLLSNACPQLKALNNGLWKELEALIRETYSVDYEEVWVVAGPIFNDENGRDYLSRQDDRSGEPPKPVEIPDGFYKIIIDVQDGEIRALAIAMDSLGAPYASNPSVTTGTLAACLVSIDDIENWTGLELFWELSEHSQAELESTAAVEMW